MSQLAILSRFYRVPAHEVLRWTPWELAINSATAMHAIAEAEAARANMGEDAMIFPVYVMSPF